MAWTEITRPKYQRDGLRYASDTTDAEWSRSSLRGEGRHRLDALALARQQQPGAVVVQRQNAVGMAGDAGEFADIGFELQTAGFALQKIHGCLAVRGTNLHRLRKKAADSGEARFCDSVRLVHLAGTGDSVGPTVANRVALPQLPQK